MKSTLKVINELTSEGVIESYALGGATALLFYAEPALTFDLDVFVFLPKPPGLTAVIDLAPLYRALKEKGYSAEREHVLIEGIPVQFIPAYNAVVSEAVREAIAKDYEGVKTRVLKMEHLFAIMADTNRPKDRERIKNLLGVVPFDRKLLTDILQRHSLVKRWEEIVGKV